MVKRDDCSKVQPLLLLDHVGGVVYAYCRELHVTGAGKAASPTVVV